MEQQFFFPRKSLPCWLKFAGAPHAHRSASHGRLLPTSVRVSQQKWLLLTPKLRSAPLNGGGRSVTQALVSAKKEILKSARSRLGECSTSDTMRLMSRAAAANEKGCSAAAVARLHLSHPTLRAELLLPATLSSGVAGGRASSRAGREGGCGGARPAVLAPLHFLFSCLSCFSGLWRPTYSARPLSRAPEILQPRSDISINQN